jgi:hypothetical protein
VGHQKFSVIFTGPHITAEYMISFGGFYLLSVENLVPLKNIEICTACVMPLPTLSLSHLGQSSCCPPRRAATETGEKWFPEFLAAEKIPQKIMVFSAVAKIPPKICFTFASQKKLSKTTVFSVGPNFQQPSPKIILLAVFSLFGQLLAAENHSISVVVCIAGLTSVTRQSR